MLVMRVTKYIFCLIVEQLCATAELHLLCCFTGGLVSLYLRGRGGLTAPGEPRLFSIYSVSIQSWPPLVGSRLLSCSLCPARQTSLIKSRDVDSRGSSSPFQNRSLTLWQTHTRSWCQITVFRNVMPYLASLQLRLPLGAYWDVLCPDKPSIPPSFRLTLSYYWWLHWLAWDFHCHHASVLGRFSHPNGTHRSCWQCSTQVLQENEELKSFDCCYNICVYCSVFFFSFIMGLMYTVWCLN